MSRGSSFITRVRRAPVRTGAASTVALAGAAVVFCTALPLAIGSPPEGGHYDGALPVAIGSPPEGGHYDVYVVSGFPGHRSAQREGGSRTPIANGGKAGYADGAPAGFSGGFGEQSCHGCHFSAEPNTPAGQVTLEGVPERFTPGERYPITIVLARTGMRLGGFQLAARFTDGGAQAGSLEGRPSDGERVKFETQGGVQYASQTKMGAAVSEPGAARWTVVWTAPDAQRSVTFHVSANAADGDESAEGDYVHTASAESAPR